MTEKYIKKQQAKLTSGFIDRVLKKRKRFDDSDDDLDLDDL